MTLYDILHTIADRLPHHSEGAGQQLHADIDQLAVDDEAGAPDVDDDQEQEQVPHA